MARVPSQPALAAQTDQNLAWFAEARSALKGPEGELTSKAAAAVARALRAEFPGVPDLGRVVMAVAGNLHTLAGALERKGGEASTDGLVTVAALAGEQLDREEAPGQRGGLVLCQLPGDCPRGPGPHPFAPPVGDGTAMCCCRQPWEARDDA